MAAQLTFVGPDSQSIISTLDARGNKIPVFRFSKQSSKPQVRLDKILPNNLLQPLGTAALSSLSGSIRLSLHNREIKMELKSESLQSNHVFDGPFGELRWKADKWGKGIECVDKAGVTLAHFDWWKMQGPMLNIFVQADTFLVELIVLGAIAKMVDDNKGLKLVGEILGAGVGA
jgi:hypothetical protein